MDKKILEDIEKYGIDIDKSNDEIIDDLYERMDSFSKNSPEYNEARNIIAEFEEYLSQAEIEEKSNVLDDEFDYSKFFETKKEDNIVVEINPLEQRSLEGEYQSALELLGTPDYISAIEKLKRIANDGHVSAQAKLGQLYNDGNRVEQNYEESVKWYQMAAEQGDAEAMFSVAYYYDVIDELRNVNCAIEWYTKAAEQGHMVAFYNLGQIYYYATAPNSIELK